MCNCLQAASVVKRYVCCGHGPALYGSCDPYAVLEVEGTRRLRTSIIQGNPNPEWEEQFRVYVADEAQKLRIVVKVSELSDLTWVHQALCSCSAHQTALFSETAGTSMATMCSMCANVATKQQGHLAAQGSRQ